MSKLSQVRPQVRTVLVIDDEADILVTLTELFQSALEGVRVLTARDGPSGLDLLQSQAVDVIVSDYRMPGMDGLEVLSRANQLAPDVPRIMLTAYPDLDLALRAINEAHIENFLTKPVRPGALLEAVNAALVKARMRPSRQAPGPTMLEHEPYDREPAAP